MAICHKAYVAFYNLRHFRACGKASALCEKYVMLTSGLIAVMSAAAHYVGALSLYMFAAVTSVNGQLNNLDYMRAFDCSEAVAVFIYLAAILSGLTAWRYSGYYEKALTDKEW